MEIIHVSAECYPVAKVGGLGDVVGALPKYLNKAGHTAKVVMPMYRTKFLYENNWVVDHKGRANLGDWFFDFTVIKEPSNKLGFDLYLVDISGLLDRESIYGYNDDSERFTAFQIAVLHWINQWQHLPDVLHCHDHHTALIPFMLKYCFAFSRLQSLPSVLTIHNAQYQGWMGWDKSRYIPAWDNWKGGLLDWKNTINPLASGIKNAWAVTTVSNSYLEEMKYQSNGLENLFQMEAAKCSGILNGIDTDVWNPATDPLILKNYNISSADKNKKRNKAEVCRRYNLDADRPLFVFIGRLVEEKAADILPDAIVSALYNLGDKISVMILGSGDREVENRLRILGDNFSNSYHCYIGYDEGLSHLLYAGADFLLMPSRVEPCGLNQMYAMKYGAMPIVRSVGGLKDTVVDIGDDGWGITFNHPSVGDIVYSIGRAVDIYHDSAAMSDVRKKMMAIDHSWEHAIDQYVELYKRL